MANAVGSRRCQPRPVVPRCGKPRSLDSFANQRSTVNRYGEVPRTPEVRLSSGLVFTPGGESKAVLAAKRRNKGEQLRLWSVQDKLDKLYKTRTEKIDEKKKEVFREFLEHFPESPFPICSTLQNNMDRRLGFTRDSSCDELFKLTDNAFEIRAAKIALPSLRDSAVSKERVNDNCESPRVPGSGNSTLELDKRSPSGLKRVYVRNMRSRSLGIMGRKYFNRPSTSTSEDEGSVKSAVEPKTSTDKSTETSALHTKANKLKRQDSSGIQSFLPTDFGFRHSRTDTFSGISRKRVTFESGLEKEIAEGARKHIVACQVASTARRGCPAIQNYQALRQCVSPMPRLQRQLRVKTEDDRNTPEHTNRAYISRLKLLKCQSTSSTSSLPRSEKEKLPEIVGTILYRPRKAIDQET